MNLLLPQNRRGQFFLAAAIIVIVVVVSLVTVSNYSHQKEEVKLYDLGKELGIESQQVLDYGTYSKLDGNEMKVLMEEFIKNYVAYMGEGKNIYFVYGNSKQINVVGYQNITAENIEICFDLFDKSSKNKEFGSEIVGEPDIGESVKEECSNELSNCDAVACCLGLVCCGDNKCRPSCEGDSSNLFGSTGDVIDEGSIPPESKTISSGTCVSYTAVGKVQEFTKEGSKEILNVVVKLDGIGYDFTLKSGENFYFIIWQQGEGGERHVVTSE